MRQAMRYWAALLGLLALAGTARAADTVIVYDASNSMWGQIEGEAKVSIARRVLADIIRDWDADTRLGLVAYGHRREGDCGDIETVAPVGEINREALIGRIEAIQPKGKTPLTDAVRHAAETLKYRDTPATVVLVSDGLETCNADPCALASELEAAGIGFTAHVIGFDVGDGADTSQLQCIAENTGGRFFAADNAEALKTALGEAARMAAEPIPEPEVTLSAPATAVAGSEVEIGWQGTTNDDDRVTIVAADAEADARGRSERVVDHSSHTLLAPGHAGRYEARYISSASGKAVARAPIELTEPETTVSAAAEVVGGAGLEIQWKKPVYRRDYVTIVAADAPADAYGDYARVGDEREARLTAPAEPGDYQVRYLLYASDRAVARAPVTVVSETVQLTAPESVTGGAKFTVGWDKRIHPRDYVTIVAADAGDAAYGDYIRVGNASEGTLNAPAEPGGYEVRYLLNESDKAVARVPITITAQQAGISAPESVTGGAKFTVTWHNAVHPRDYVTIVPAGAEDDAYGDYTRVGNASEGALVAPAEPGDYEVRYLLNESDRAIARVPITVTAQQAGVSAPASVTGGARFTVTWSNAVHPRDYVTIVPAGAEDGAYGDYTRVSNADEGRLQAPAEPGDYEVRYLLEQNDETIARAPIRVEAPSVSISGPERVTGGAAFTVRWNKSVHPRDYVTIVPGAAPDDEYGNYTRVGNAREGKLVAPVKPGAYELRYALQVNERAIARTPITVVAPEVALQAPEKVTAESSFTVSWDRTIHPRDYVTVVAADAGDDAHGEYRRVGNATEASLPAPAEPGRYQVRYLLQANDRAIARVPVEVVAGD